MTPRATYRLQLVPGGLDFAAAADLVGYLADLGVTHLYLSPVLAARAGSTHGYDVADPTLVAPALGGEDGLRRLAAAAAARGLGLVADIVPNHLGTGPDNPLWEALLAEGAAGSAGAVFDVDWGETGKVVLPVLGEQYGVALADGDLEVAEEGGRLRVRYHEHSFPLSPETLEALERSGLPETTAQRHALLESQHYRLVYWRTGNALVNYRRFFAVNELAAVRVEDSDVFERTHEVILRLVADGVLDGLRVDHPDGLRDPGRYLARLSDRTGGVWTVVEKILARGEAPPDWPVAGTTGYDFTNDVLGLFVDPSFGSPEFEQVGVAAKREVLATDLAAELRRLGQRLWAISQRHPEVRDVDDVMCTEVLARILAAMDVYRTYVDPETGAATDTDRAVVRRVVERAREPVLAGLYDFLAELLCGGMADDPEALDLLARFQQLSAAVMAKGVEDTAFYRHLRLVALNEVGGDPAQAGVTAAEFHAANARRPAGGMLTTATHDTKRGEDVRLRIAALSELPDRWLPGVEPLLFQTLVGVWPVDEPGRVRDYMMKASREAGMRTSWSEPDEAFEEALCESIDGLLADPSFCAAMDDLIRDVREIATVSSLAQTLLRCTSPGVPDTYQGTELWEDNLVDPDNRRPVDFALRRRLLADLDDGADPAALWAERADGRVKLWVLSRALRARAAQPHAAAGAYAPLRTTGAWAEHLVAFARTSGQEALVTIVPRLPGRVIAAGGWGDTAVEIPPTVEGEYHDVLALRTHTLGPEVRAADLLTPLPVALLQLRALP